MRLQLNSALEPVPFAITALVLIATVVVAPFTSYRSVIANVAVYLFLSLFATSVITHGILVARVKPRRRQVLYSALHIPIQGAVVIGCMMVVAKDSL